jgi:rifampin ADP-ribosylating transferase
MEFSPFNNIVKLCLQGMEKEEQGKPEEASKIFLQSWDETTNDFEKFLAAHYVARHQKKRFGQIKMA